MMISEVPGHPSVLEMLVSLLHLVLGLDWGPFDLMTDGGEQRAAQGLQGLHSPSGSAARGSGGSSLQTGLNAFSSGPSENLGNRETVTLELVQVRLRHS